MSLRHLLQASALGLAAAFSLPALADTGHTYDFGKPAQAAQATRTVEIKLGEMFFEPESIDVKPGETVRFVIHNTGSLLHEFNLGSAAMHAGHQKEMQQMMDTGMLTPTGMQHDMSQMDHSKMGHGDMPDDEARRSQQRAGGAGQERRTDLDLQQGHQPGVRLQHSGALPGWHGRQTDRQALSAPR